MSTMMHETAEAFIALEQRLLTAIFRADKTGMTQLMLPDGIGVDGSFGHALQHDLIAGIHQLDTVSWRTQDPRVLPFGAEAVILTYRLYQVGSFQGEPLPAQVYCTSAWRRIGGQWLAIFHQESPAIEEAT